MKKYLLFVMSMLVLVTNVKAGVTLSDSNSYLVLTTTEVGDINSGFDALDWSSYNTNSYIGLKIVGPINNDDISKLAGFNKELYSTDGIIDFSGATLGEGVTINTVSNKFTIMRVPTSYSLETHKLPTNGETDTFSFAFSTDASSQKYWNDPNDHTVLNLSVNAGGLTKAQSFSQVVFIMAIRNTVM